MPRTRTLIPALLAATLLATACGDREETALRSADGRPVEALPAPGGVTGSVTGMPGARPDGVLDDTPMTAEDALAALPPDTAIDSDGNVLMPDGTPWTGEATSPPYPGDAGAGGGEPGWAGPDPAREAEAAVASQAGADPANVGEAVEAMRGYFDAINRDQFNRAHALWADGGRASGQSAAQFAGSFAQTGSLAVEFLPPGRVEASGGARYVEVPVAYTQVYRDGSQRRFVGAYTLRHAGPDAGWRIASADIREVQP